MILSLPLQSTYATLPDRFFTAMAPTPVKAPELLLLNAPLAKDLGLDPRDLQSDDGVSLLAGSAVSRGSKPLAQVYAGHQFGGFSPQLGDGRAILLGELIGTDGNRYDMQLKGSGPTPYSRMGDGRAWLGPVLREYVVSEAMVALGVPTTRALAAVATGEPVYREGPMPGAVLTRIAASHIRVGTFQYFAARKDVEALEALTDYTIARHYPNAEGPLDLLKAVVAAQARLIAKWMSFGFVHGVMNTDNCQIAGETIDYGPCAFLDTYHPGMVFSSIDRDGRYAFGQQPNIAAWNLAQFATCLLPLMGEREAAIDQATHAVQGFAKLFETAWLEAHRPKLGLTGADESDLDLITELLQVMAEERADFTNTFRSLTGPKAADQFLKPEAFMRWHSKWQTRLERETNWQTRMNAANPAVIPRTHRIEEAIQAAVAGDFEPTHRLIAALAQPFDDNPEFDDLRRPPTDDERVPQTFCGT